MVVRVAVVLPQRKKIVGAPAGIRKGVNIPDSSSQNARSETKKLNERAMVKDASDLAHP